MDDIKKLASDSTKTSVSSEGKRLASDRSPSAEIPIPSLPPKVTTQVETGSRKDRIRKATLEGGLKNIPNGFDDKDGDWAVIKSENPFEVLYLDHGQYKAITPEMAKNNFGILSDLWDGKIHQMMSSSATGTQIIQKYGGEQGTEKTIQNFKRLLERAYKQLRSGIEKCFLEIDAKRREDGITQIKPIIYTILKDHRYDPIEKEALLESGREVGLREEEMLELMIKSLENKGFYPMEKISDEPTLDEKLQVIWVEKGHEDKLKVYATPPYKFTANAIAKTPKELSMLIQTFGDRELVKKHFSKGWFSNWLGSFDQELAYKVTEIEEKVKDVDLALLEVSYILDPEMPYILLPGNQAETLEELATLIDKNWEVGKEHIFSGKVSIWLKHAGYQDIYERLEQIKKEFHQEQDRGVEIFLQLLGLPKPEFTIEPSMADIGAIESTAGKVTKKIKLTHTGRRGYFYGEIKFSKEIEGISFSTTNVTVLAKGVEGEEKRLIELMRDAETRKDEKAFSELEQKLKELEKSHFQKGLKEITANTTDVIKINLWLGESIEFNLNIDAEKLQVNKGYELSIITRTNAASEINLPVSFFVDYPAYSKKRAKIVFKVDNKDFYTLKDLAQYYLQIMSSKADVSYLFGKGHIDWIKNDLDEKQLAQRVEEIISSNINDSEKWYRFLKLCGVFSERELTALFKKLRSEEFEVEKKQNISKVKGGIQQRVKDRMSRIFREGLGGSLTGWGIGFGILFAIAAPIIDYANLSAAFYRGAGQSRFNPPAKMPSLPDGSISDAAGMGLLLGIFIGLIICLNQRSNRANKVPILPEEERELSLETKAIEEELVRKIAGVDEEILQIKKGISTTKPISKEGFSGAIVDPKISVKIPIVILSILVIILLIPSINAFKIPSHPIFAPVCSDAQDITFEPPSKKFKVQLRQDCWSGWISYKKKSALEWRVEGGKKAEYFFWDGSYYHEGKKWGGKHWGMPFRLRGEGVATVVVKYR